MSIHRRNKFLNVLICCFISIILLSCLSKIYFIGYEEGTNVGTDVGYYNGKNDGIKLMASFITKDVDQAYKCFNNNEENTTK